MSKNFAVIGGDLRIVNLARLIAKDEKQVYVYGLEKVEEIKNISNLIITKTLEEAISKANFEIFLILVGVLTHFLKMI